MYVGTIDVPDNKIIYYYIENDDIPKMRTYIIYIIHSTETNSIKDDLNIFLKLIIIYILLCAILIIL